MNYMLRGLLWLQKVAGDFNGSGKVSDTSCCAIGLSSEWQVLGPFQIGTREATWGADPLEYFGGFGNLSYDKSCTYHSSIGVNGTVGWSLRHICALSHDAKSAEANVTFAFPEIDWTFLQSIYGWAALQYQAWARGQIMIHTGQSQTVLLYTDNVLEYTVDGEHYFGGDFYAYRRAPLILQLTPGVHQIDLRLVRDIRAMGGVGKPLLHVNIKVELSTNDLVVVEDEILLPEMAAGSLVSSLGSVPLRNEGQKWMNILTIRSMQEDAWQASMLDTHPFKLAPGQSRPLSFRITKQNVVNSQIALEVTYEMEGFSRIHQSTVFSSVISMKTFREAHKMTFLHPSGVVSYAILQCPKLKSPNFSDNDSLPILLNLHGAGLEADSDQVRHMLDGVDDIRAWTLFPTGVTTWSGDDWHTWGFADIEAAVASIPLWIESVAWQGPTVDLDRWYVVGHSNGGQGTWFALTHQPDKIMAAAPVSGYSSIQAYVPYQFWTITDPRLAMVLQNSLVSYRHELFMDNFLGISVLQQHGGADENVPVYHSRRLKQLVDESRGQSRYVELTGQGHWFDGIMTSEPLRTFYHNIAGTNKMKPELPEAFTIIIPNSGKMGSRGGIEVDQLISPDQLGRIDVVRNHRSSKWILLTSNVHRFHFSSTHGDWQLPNIVDVDNITFDNPSSVDGLTDHWFVRSPNGSWKLTSYKEWQCIGQRHGAQRGALDAVLQTTSRLLVQSQNYHTFPIASQVARNLFQYFAADSEIIDTVRDEKATKGNIISIVQGIEDTSWGISSHAIEVRPESGICVRHATGYQKCYPFVKGLGAVYLQPLAGERLQLVVWGFDESGLRYASRLVPMLTGVGQADFIIVSRECLWKGAAGALAMGFFDHAWKVSHASYTR